MHSELQKLTLTVTEDGMPFLKGHFPGNPVVPGAVLLGWMLDACGELLKADEPRQVKRVKFLQPLRPGARLEITTEVTEGAVAVSARNEEDPGHIYARAMICR